MQNPFESGHIKNYVFLYVSVVIIMILFFIASTLFIEEENIEKKVFNTEVNETIQEKNRLKHLEEERSLKTKFKLLDKAY